VTEKLNFQEKVAEWIAAAFGAESKYNVAERSHRFLEEALELYQSVGCTKEDATKLIEYVYDRPAGEVKQEIGAVALTLFSLGDSTGADVEACAVSELVRVWAKIDQIRAKNSAKPLQSPLPGRTESCVTCQKSKQRATDRKGRLSSEFLSCSIGSISLGSHIRNKDDWCDRWEEKRC